MKKNTELVNIYLKIHNKQPLTMEDLQYLAWYAPECFEKTCKNVVYNMPETKPIMVPEDHEKKPTSFEPEKADSQAIENVLENLKSLEADELPFSGIQADTVKNLLGNLYMEMLFPHTGQTGFLGMPEESSSQFDKKI